MHAPPGGPGGMAPPPSHMEGGGLRGVESDLKSMLLSERGGVEGGGRARLGSSTGGAMLSPRGRVRSGATAMVILPYATAN